MLRLVAAGLLALPALLWTVITIPISIILSLPAAMLLLARKKKDKQQPLASKKPEKRQVVITGGSSGIGLAIAKIAAQHYDIHRIVLLARNMEKLQTAQQSIETNDSSTEIVIHSVDVTNPEAVQACAATIMKENFITHLFCCAGEPHPAYFQTVPPECYVRLVQTNQLGSIHVTNAFLKHMSKGTIQLCSSMGGQVGVFGFSAYSPTKFALRGYAECLHMELLHNPDIHIQVAYPPDTDTPGFAKENEGKPPETALISESAGLATPHAVASVMLKEALCANPKFNIYFSFDGFLLCTLTCGFSPVSTILDAVAQLSALNLTRWIALFYLSDWHRIIAHHKKVSDDRNAKSKLE